jgi:hypothetical protein
VTSLAFARALLARWDRRVVATQPIARVFLRRPDPGRAPMEAAVETLSLRRDVHVDLRPQISLTLVRGGGVTVYATHVGGDRVSVPQLEKLVLRTSSAVRAERLLERLVSRGERVEVIHRPPPAALGRTGAPHRKDTARPELLVRRAADAVADDGAHRQAPRLRGSGSDVLTAASARSIPPAEPTVDVSRVTDQVLAAIDGRLIAQGERLGRS